MYRKIKHLLPILFIITTLVGCTLYKFDKSSTFVSNETPSLSNNPIKEEGQNDGVTVPSPNVGNGAKIDWQIEFRDDPSVIRDERVTYLPEDTLVFIVTFNEVMDRDSVEDAFRQNIVDPSIGYPMLEAPLLHFRWMNPLQVEIIVEGKGHAHMPGHYTLSPNGAMNKEHTQQLSTETSVAFKLTKNKAIYTIDSYGQQSKHIAEVPYALVPVALNINSDELILARTYASNIQGKQTAYVFDLNNQKITRYFSDLMTLPFWGNDETLRLIKETAVIRVEHLEEQWKEFGDFPYIYGWSISPDLQYEVYIVSKEQVVEDTLVSIMVVDLVNHTETVFETILPMKALSPAMDGNDYVDMIWTNDQQHLYLRPTGGISDALADAYLLDIHTGNLTMVPTYLQNGSGYSKPAWSHNGEYVAVASTVEKPGIYDRDGNLIREWVTYIPKGSFYWHPAQLIVAYAAQSETEEYVIQFNLESGEMIITEGAYSVLGWNRDGTQLYVFD